MKPQRPHFAVKPLLCAAALLCNISLAHSASINPAATQKAAQASLHEWMDVLTLPNDSNVAADIQKNAEWFKAALEKRGFTVKLLPNQGKPMLLATATPIPGNEKTVLIYGHMDGQAVKPSEWEQESPWKPVLK